MIVAQHIVNYDNYAIFSIFLTAFLYKDFSGVFLRFRRYAVVEVAVSNVGQQIKHFLCFVAIWATNSTVQILGLLKVKVH